MIKSTVHIAVPRREGFRLVWLILRDTLKCYLRRRTAIKFYIYGDAIEYEEK